jgi:hypothetical protein
MVKNVTVQVGDDLAAKMEKLLDVNWSQVVRSCIQQYCNIRLNPDIEALMQKMKEQKEEAYSEGYKTALEWFKQEEVRYEDVDKVFRELDRLIEDFDRQVEEKYESEEFEEFPSLAIKVTDSRNRKKREFWAATILDVMEGVHREKRELDVTDAFIEGFKTALKKLEKVS